MFYGIIIALYHNDHSPPHFHAVYGEHEAVIAIETREIIAGSRPRRARGLVLEWAELCHEELRVAWERARCHEPLSTIEPLQ